MNAARLSEPYRDAYFQELHSAHAHSTTLAGLVARLYETPTQGGGKKSLQFSFATKPLHTVDRQTPIYDSFVARFYFFEPLGSDNPLPDRINNLLSFHNFLCAEGARILADGLLVPSILAFRSQLKPQHHTDMRIVDHLIWAYIDQLNRGALIDGRIVFR